MNIDLAESDWGTVVQRRNSREPVERGGWSMLHTTGGATAWANPALSFLVRGQGLRGWFGWWESARAEELAEAWLYETDPAKQRSLAGELGRHALEEAAFRAARPVPDPHGLPARPDGDAGGFLPLSVESPARLTRLRSQGVASGAPRAHNGAAYSDRTAYRGQERQWTM